MTIYKLPTDPIFVCCNYYYSYLSCVEIKQVSRIIHCINCCYILGKGFNMFVGMGVGVCYYMVKGSVHNSILWEIEWKLC